MDIEVPEMANELLQLAKSNSKHEVNLKPFFLDHALNRVSESIYGINTRKNKDYKVFFGAAQRTSASLRFTNPALSIGLNLLQHFPKLLKIFPFYNKDMDNLFIQNKAFLDARAASGINRKDFAQMTLDKADELKEKPKLDKILNDEILYTQVLELLISLVTSPLYFNINICLGSITFIWRY